MKKLSYLFASLTLIATSFGFVACDDDKDETKPSCSTELAADGTCDYSKVTEELFKASFKSFCDDNDGECEEGETPESLLTKEKAKSEKCLKDFMAMYICGWDGYSETVCKKYGDDYEACSKEPNCSTELASDGTCDYSNVTEALFKSRYEKLCVGHPDACEAGDTADSLLATAKAESENCLKDFMAMYICGWDGYSETVCKKYADDYAACSEGSANAPTCSGEQTQSGTCDYSKVTEEQFKALFQPHCQKEVEEAQNNSDPDDDDKTLASCLAELNEMLADQKNNYPDCLNDYLQMMTCYWDSWNNDKDPETECATYDAAVTTCYETKYPSEPVEE